MEKYTYLLINFFSILVPLLFSFGKRIRFYKSYSALFPAMLITTAFFILWDHYMTIWSVWGFNPKYVTGIYLWDLPIEEWLFFIAIPYSCMFVYISLNYFFKKDHLQSYSKNISAGLIVILSIVVLFNTEKLYTAIKLSLSALMLIYIVLKKTPYMGKFYRAYLVCLIPFFIVNGLLTAIPVVTYNDAENLGIRLGTIPIEDSIYMLLMLLMNTTLFEHFKSKQEHVKPSGSHRP